MTWCRRLWQRLHGYPELRGAGLVALELRVYKVATGALLLVAAPEVALSVVLAKPQALALVDTILDAVGAEAADDPPLAS